MKKIFSKLIALGVITTSLLAFNPISANAEWKHNKDNTWGYSDASGNNATNGWIKDKNDWYFFKDGVMQTGWIKENGKYYYLSSNGNMLTNTTTPDGYKVGTDGVWIQNNTVNSNNTTTTKTDNNIDATTNSNNMTNLTDNVDNSSKSSSDITLNNTGVINNNTTNNNYDVKVNNKKSDDDSVAKAIEKSRKEANERLKISYKSSLENMKDKLADAKTKLEKVKNSKTVQTYEKQVDGSFQFVYKVDAKKIKEAEKDVEFYKDKVDFYEKMLDSLDD